MIIGITSDHRGFEIKKELIKELKNKNIEIKDNGCFTPGSCDYSLYGISLAEEVAKKKYYLWYSNMWYRNRYEYSL